MSAMIVVRENDREDVEELLRVIESEGWHVQDYDVQGHRGKVGANITVMQK